MAQWIHPVDPGSNPEHTMYFFHISTDLFTWHHRLSTIQNNRRRSQGLAKIEKMSSRKFIAIEPGSADLQTWRVPLRLPLVQNMHY